MTNKNQRSDDASSKFVSSLNDFYSPKKKKTPSKNPNPCTTGGPLPEDMILEIISRLPLKSLLRFRSVCKSWHAIIHSPSFVDVHFTQSQSRTRPPQFLLSISDSDSDHYFYSASVEGGAPVHLLSMPGCKKNESSSPCECYVSECLNGLVCFYNGHNVYVINPSIRRSITLPPPASDYTNCKLDEDGYEYYSGYSFGYDPSNNEYKVLHIMGTRYMRTRRLSDLQCEVFTIKVGSKEPKLVFNSHDDDDDIGSWRKITPPPCVSRSQCIRVDDVTIYPRFAFKEEGVCVNGAIHWICSKPSTASDEEILVVFDVGSEKFRWLPLPPPDVCPKYNLTKMVPDFPLPPHAAVCTKYNLTKIEGRLALLNYMDSDASTTEIWVLEENCHKKWVQKTVVAPQECGILFTLMLSKELNFWSTPRPYYFVYWDHINYKASPPILLGKVPFCWPVSIGITNHVDSLSLMHA
ncbi:putative F-box protein At5g52610 [Cornus florida]|uniref:putative F-box protein At5g52610 n=1 Tax=Cornus florida TaxID=4283 RepID=UPI0028A02B2A|nr:putative F-box protein At5g52610 [Cornus florida]